MNKLLTAAFCTGILSIGMTATAHAAIMNVEMSGFISGKPSLFLNTTPVKVGDNFAISFSFDDGQQYSSNVYVSGDLYTKVTQPFSPPLLSWSGSMPNEIAQHNTPTLSGSIDGWGVEESWYRPITTLHNNEWHLTSGAFSGNPGQRGFEIDIVTNYGGALVGYGWWSIGTGTSEAIGSNTIDYGYLTITSLSITPVSPVPEPRTYAMMLSGLLALIGFARLNQQS